MYPAQYIAYYFIKLSVDDNDCTLTPMKLQKLLYFAHGFYLTRFSKSLIYEVFYAWKFGPVIGQIYHEFKNYGVTSIKDNPLFYGYHNSVADYADKIIDPVTVTFLKSTWENFKKFSAFELSTFTHAGISPWDMVTKPFQDDIANLPPSLLIPNPIIKAYFDTITSGLTSDNKDNLVASK